MPKPNKPSSATIQRVPLPIEVIERRIYLIRGNEVMLDGHLAELYRVSTSRLNEAVRRNRERFPDDFMFQLAPEEAESLLSQNAISKKASRGGRRTLPFAFTEHGVAMLSAILKSQRAVQMSILIVRAFVKIRELLANNQDLASRVEKLETSQQEHASVIGILAGEIDDMKRLPEPPKRRIGFKATA